MLSSTMYALAKMEVTLSGLRMARDTQRHSGVTASNEFIDLWTEVREWSVRPV